MKRWFRRLQRADRHVVDRWVAAAFVVIGEFEMLLQWNGGGSLPLQILLIGGGYAMLAWRRSRPVLAGAGMFACWIVANTVLVELHNLQFPLIAVLGMCYAMGAYTTGRAALLAPFVIVAVMTGVIVSYSEQVFTDFVFPTAFALIAWVAGRGLRTRSQLTE